MEKILEKQKAFFATGITLGRDFREQQLDRLYRVIVENEPEILNALQKDLNKSSFEAYETEIGLVLEEISFMKQNLKRFMKPKKVKTPLAHFPSRSRIYMEPYGSILIMSPWNYPFQLALVPLVGAIATGNCAFVKPSNYALHTSAIMKKLLTMIYDEEYVAVVEGGREANQELLSYPFDYIFFTGSVSIGKLVMERAAKHLTPVTLELGGKSPCIVDATADIALAARRIIWGKMLNSGQTCVAPDYVLVQEEIRGKLIDEMKQAVVSLYGEEPHLNSQYPRIINQKHFERLNGLIERGNVICGGRKNEQTRQIELTLMEADWNSEIMEDEIFGPILPILTYKDSDEVISKVNQRPKPLALYLFTTSKEVKNKIVKRISYGGGCINDTVVHLASSYLPFGGVGNSGMGGYHGENSFRLFSHSKSVLEKGNWLDIPVRYAPYDRKKEKILRILLK